MITVLNSQRTLRGYAKHSYLFQNEILKTLRNSYRATVINYTAKHCIVLIVFVEYRYLAKIKPLIVSQLKWMSAGLETDHSGIPVR